MAGADLIGRRGRGEPYLLGLDVDVAEIVRAHQALAGSESETAEYLRLPEPGVRAALEYANEHPVEGSQADGPSEEPSVLARLGQVAGLAGALATIVYIAGGLVLALRLQSSHVDSTAVIGQVPREFLLTIGLSQVLLPALLVASVYVAYRLLRATDIGLPLTEPFRTRTTRVRNMISTGVITLVVLAPAAVAAYEGQEEFEPGWLGVAVLIALLVGLAASYARKVGNQQHEKRHTARTSILGLLFVGASVVGIVGIGVCALYAVGLGDELEYLGPAFVAAMVTAGLVVEARARLGRRAGDDDSSRTSQWAQASTVAQMTALYAGALIVAAVIFWPRAVELPSAKVCTTTGFEERGDLIGTGSGGVYLAEPLPAKPSTGERPASRDEKAEARRQREAKSRLIAAYPSDRLEELFIGKGAGEASCDPKGEPPAVLTRQASGRAGGAAKRAKRVAAEVAAATDVPTARAALLRVASETAAAAAADHRTASIVNRWVPTDMRFEPAHVRPARAASNRVRDIAKRSGGTLTQRLRKMSVAADTSAEAAEAAAAEALSYAASALGGSN